MEIIEKRKSTKRTLVSDEVRMDESAKLSALWDRAKRATKRPLSQKEFAEKYDLGGQAFCQQLLNGYRPINLESAIKFAAYLKCDVGDFSPRLKSVLEKYVATVNADSTMDDIVAKLTPERADFLRKFDQLPSHNQSEIITIVNDRYRTVMETIKKLAGPSVSEKLVRMTENNELIN